MEKIVFKEEKSLNKKDKEALHLLLNPLFTWSVDVRKKLYYSSASRWRAMLYLNSNLIASLSIVSRRKIINCRPMLVGGIGNLGVVKKFQGKGYAARILELTKEFLRKKDVDFLLLFCGKDRVGLYLKCGYTQMKKSVSYYRGKQLKEEPVALFLPLNLSEEEKNFIFSRKIHIGRGTW